ncbi:reverse transcriptase domain-containing protein [Tanacetum coccineum]
MGSNFEPPRYAAIDNEVESDLESTTRSEPKCKEMGNTYESGEMAPSRRSGPSNDENPDIAAIIAQQLQNIIPQIIFLACNPRDYDGKGGAVALTRWIEKMESVIENSGCAENQKVKYAASSFINKALTWWNTQVQARGREAAIGMSWVDFKALLVEEFCSSNKMEKLESELWNHTMVGANHAGYTNWFHELAKLVPHLVTPESKRIGRYINGLPPQIRRMLRATQPTTIHSAILKAGILTDEAVRCGTLTRNSDKRKEVEETSKQGADFSFISTKFAPLLNVKPSIVNPGYVIEVADVGYNLEKENLHWLSKDLSSSNQNTVSKNFYAIQRGKAPDLLNQGWSTRLRRLNVVVNLVRTDTKDHNDSLIAQVNSKTVENADLKAQIQEKVFANVALKNELRKLKGNSVDTKFAKASILGKPPLQPSRNHLVVRQPNAFTSERPRISRPTVCPSQVHGVRLEEARKMTQNKTRIPSHKDMASTRAHCTPNACTPKPRNIYRSSPVSKCSGGMSNGEPLVDHSRNSSFFLDSKKSFSPPRSETTIPLNQRTTLINLGRRNGIGQRFSLNKSSAVHEKPHTPRSYLRWKPTGRIFKTVSLRWIPTGKVFIDSTTKVDSEPPNGSNDDITNPYECNQTLYEFKEFKSDEHASNDVWTKQFKPRSSSNDVWTKQFKPRSSSNDA